MVTCLLYEYKHTGGPVNASSGAGKIPGRCAHERRVPASANGLSMSASSLTIESIRTFFGSASISSVMNAANNVPPVCYFLYLLAAGVGECDWLAIRGLRTYIALSLLLVTAGQRDRHTPSLGTRGNTAVSGYIQSIPISNGTSGSALHDRKNNRTRNVIILVFEEWSLRLGQQCWLRRFALLVARTAAFLPRSEAERSLYIVRHSCMM